jgi:hypothetical protein
MVTVLSPRGIKQGKFDPIGSGGDGDDNATPIPVSSCPRLKSAASSSSSHNPAQQPTKQFGKTRDVHINRCLTLKSNPICSLSSLPLPDQPPPLAAQGQDSRATVSRRPPHVAQASIATLACQTSQTTAWGCPGLPEDRSRMLKKLLYLGILYCIFSFDFFCMDVIGLVLLFFFVLF